MPGLDLHDLGQTGASGPGVRRALDTGLRQCRHQLAHVHVHAATVARPRLGQGRGVERKHGDTLHGDRKPYRTDQHSVSVVGTGLRFASTAPSGTATQLSTYLRLVSASLRLLPPDRVSLRFDCAPSAPGAHCLSQGLAATKLS